MLLSLSDAEKAAMYQLLARQLKEQMVNQSTYGPLIDSPVAIAYKTKTETPASKGDDQLAVWNLAWIQRTAVLMGNTWDHKRWLPAIRIIERQVLILLIWKREDGTLCMSDSRAIAEIDDLVGAYQALAVFRRLGRWAHVDFRTWYQQNVLNLGTHWQENCK